MSNIKTLPNLDNIIIRTNFSLGKPAGFTANVYFLKKESDGEQTFNASFSEKNAITLLTTIVEYLSSLPNASN